MSFANQGMPFLVFCGCKGSIFL